MEDEQVVSAETPVEIVEQAMEAPDEGASSINAPINAPSGEQTEDTRPAWVKAIDEAPADEIRRHQKFAGILGTEKQRWESEQRTAHEAQQRAQAEADRAKALEQARAELRELYDQNPLAYADKKFTEDQIREAQERIENVQKDARRAVASQIGSSFHDIPEWKEIVGDPDRGLQGDPEAFARLTTAIQGVPEDLVLPTWNRVANELIAEKRAERKAEERVQERVNQERTAWETEMAANGFIASDRPQLLKGRGVANLDPEPHWQKQPKEWEAWYERNNRRAG